MASAFRNALRLVRQPRNVLRRLYLKRRRKRVGIKARPTQLTPAPLPKGEGVLAYASDSALNDEHQYAEEMARASGDDP